MVMMTMGFDMKKTEMREKNIGMLINSSNQSKWLELQSIDDAIKLNGFVYVYLWVERIKVRKIKCRWTDRGVDAWNESPKIERTKEKTWGYVSGLDL